MRKIYLDNAASVRSSKKVAEAVGKFLVEEYGNPSSLHEMGARAREKLNEVRKEIAENIGAKEEEIYFTSGATESNNIAIQGLARVNPEKKIVISAIEHPSVREVAFQLREEGYEVIEIPVDREGRIKIDEFKRVLEDDDILIVSVMHVNNIIGSIQPIQRIGEICREKGILFHTDAVQSFGKLEIDVRKMKIDLLSLSGHKIGAPKGVGALYVRKGVIISPIMFGGGQEKGLRSGTENVSGIAGLGEALKQVKKIDKDEIGKIRDEMIEKLEKIGGKINGGLKDRIYNNIHVSFEGIEGDTLVEFLSRDSIYVSAGSACDSKKGKEDHVLRATGFSGKGSIRITLNENIGEKGVDFVVEKIKRSVETLRV